MEHNLMTVKDIAEYLRLNEQTIQRYVMRREIPFHKVKKVIRFRFSEIEQWIDSGGGACPEHSTDRNEVEGGSPLDYDNENLKGGLFAELKPEPLEFEGQ